jgi:hypothetical protein
MPNDIPTASPVFVDPTGRRRRTIRMAAVIGAGSLLTVGALLVAALLGAPIAPSAFLPQPLPEPAADHGDVHAPPAPLASDQPSPDAEPASGSAPDTPSVTLPPPPGNPTTAITTHGRSTNSQQQGKPTDLPAPAPPGQTR